MIKMNNFAKEKWNKFSGNEHYLLMQIRTGFNENVKNKYI